MSSFKTPHRRYNLLTEEWVLVSPQRNLRPWQGQQEAIPPQVRSAYDPNCYLCPGNSRHGGLKNPNYEDLFIFDNDFPALLGENSDDDAHPQNLLIADAEKGVCRVMCFSPRHDLSLPDLNRPTLRKIIDAWSVQYLQLADISWINHVQIFENKGAMMGCSNPHPHCQIWATASIPVEPFKELGACRRYFGDQKKCMLCDYLEQELKQKERVVELNDSFAVVVPFWAVWPFETLLVARRHVATISDLSATEKDGLADILKKLTIRYDNLFRTSFPYSMGFHQKPTNGQEYPELHLHAHFYPPLLRSATVKKFMVGFEMLGEPQRDITAEDAAARLRQLPTKYYREAESAS